MSFKQLLRPDNLQENQGIELKHGTSKFHGPTWHNIVTFSHSHGEILSSIFSQNRSVHFAPLSVFKTKKDDPLLNLRAVQSIAAK